MFFFELFSIFFEDFEKINKFMPVSKFKFNSLINRIFLFYTIFDLEKSPPNGISPPKHPLPSTPAQMLNYKSKQIKK